MRHNRDNSKVIKVATVGGAPGSPGRPAPPSLYVDDRLVAGKKQAGGGNVLRSFDVEPGRLLCVIRLALGAKAFAEHVAAAEMMAERAEIEDPR